MNRFNSPFAFAFAFTSVATLVGCSDEILGQCADGGDSVCPSGTVCAFGLCVDANQLGTVDIEVEPVAASGLPVQAVFDVDATRSDGARTEVALKNGQSLSGVVETTAGGGVAAALRAVPLRSIPGRLRTPSTESDASGVFGLTLLDEAEYNLNVTPSGGGFPPLEITAIDASYDDAIVVDATAFVELQGRILKSDGNEPQPDVEVFAQLERRRLSTTATTGADGRFALVARELPFGAQLVIVPGANRAQPTVVVTLDPASGAIDLGDLSFGGGVTRPVSGTVTSSEGPARGAIVVFRALVGAGVFAAQVEAGEDGRFETALIAGNYVVGVVPAVDRRAGLLVLPEPLDVSGPIDDLIIPLPSRRDASVRITTSEDAPVVSASVTLQRIGDEFGVAEAVLQDVQPEFLGSTDNDGNAHLVVDTGRYRMSIKPSPDSGVPAFSTLINVDGTFTRDFVLPPANVLAGVVVDDGGVAAAGAFVRVFSRLVDERGRAIFLGEALCSSDGSFAVSVPNLTP